MTISAPFHALFTHPVIPLASVRAEGHIEAIGDGLVDGGLPVVEVALRGDLAVQSIRQLAARGDLLVGAGTVRSTAQASQIIDAGAQFIVTPGLDEDVVNYAARAGVPIIPGVLTPTEIGLAARLGLTRVKLFPAAAVDAIAMLNAYADVFPDMRFMPSAGLNVANATEFLAHRAVFAISGSWIAAAAHDGAAAVSAAAREALEVAHSAALPQ
jgi:2-dehydro-3-deoxyphosphogluconate aldolase / (4S)-4-hydroxy-2-oxoglutarate aldolase